jgi:hypothetical protein
MQEITIEKFNQIKNKAIKYFKNNRKIISPIF